MALVSRAEVVNNLNKVLLWNSGNRVRTTWQHRAPCTSALTAQAGSLHQVWRCCLLLTSLLIAVVKLLRKTFGLSQAHLAAWPGQDSIHLVARRWHMRHSAQCAWQQAFPGDTSKMSPGKLLTDHKTLRSTIGVPLSQNNQDCLQSLFTISKEIIFGVKPKIWMKNLNNLNNLREI